MRLFTTEVKARLIAEHIIKSIKNTAHQSLTQEGEKELEERITGILERIIKEELDYFDEAERELANGEEVGV